VTPAVVGTASEFTKWAVTDQGSAHKAENVMGYNHNDRFYKKLTPHQRALMCAERERNRARRALDRAAERRALSGEAGKKAEAAYAKAFASWSAAGRRIANLHRNNRIAAE
jgi:hypothetical protein